MATIAGRAYSTPKNVNLKQGLLRFDVSKTSNPFSNDSKGWGLYINSSNELIFWNKTTAITVAASAAANTLNAAYGQGRTITMDTGAIIFNDATTDATNLLEFNKTGTGSGNILDFDFTAAFTGQVLNLDMGSAVGAIGLQIDSEAGARTGADIQITDDSTATHIVFDVNKSGAGATTGFDWTDSYTGSPASFAIRITAGNANGLDDTDIYISRGTGVRTNPVLDINDASTGSADIIDVDLTGIYTGDVFDFATTAAATGNVFFINLDNAVAMTALHVEGSGVRTQPYVELSSDSTGSAIYIDCNIDGAGSGNFFDVVTSTTYTGNVIAINLNAAVGAVALLIDGSNEIRTANLANITNDGSGNTDFMEITDSNTGSGHVFDINSSGIGSGNVIDITYSAADTGDALKVVMADNVAGGALVITGAGARTDSIIDVVSAETGSIDGMVLFSTSGVFTGHILTVSSTGAATTGGLVHLDLDAGVAYKAITIDHAGARTVASILVTFDGTVGAAAGGTFLDGNITMTGASAAPWIDIDITGAYTGNVFDVLIGASLATGDVLSIDLGATATGSQAMVVASGAMTRTTALFQVTDSGTSSGAMFDLNRSGANTGIMFDIDDTAIATGNVFDYATNSATTGVFFNVNLTNAVAMQLEVYTLAGTRTSNANTVTHSAAGAVDIWQIDDSGTSSGHVWDVNSSGNSTGNVLDIVMSASKVAGHAIHADMGTDLAGNAILIDAAGVRTAPLIYIANTGTDGGTDDHVLFINQTGLLDSNLIQLTFATAVSTGDALNIDMGAGTVNVAGRAIAIASAGTGVSGEGNAIDILHTGALVAGADVMSIDTTGSISSTSNVLSVTQRTGAGTTGAFAVYISATGTNVEALKVDDGNVTFDEALTVVGLITYTGATGISDGTTTLAATMLEVNRTCDVSGRLVAAGSTLSATVALHDGKIIALDTASGSVVTLPAATGTGAVLKFLVTVLATTNSHVIKVADASDTIEGTIWSVSTGDTPDLGQPWIATAGDDTITLNRTTTGSAVIRGEWFELVDVATDLWLVRGVTHASGAEATPFSATV